MATTALEVVTLADAKRFLRVSGSDDDALITSHIGAAVGWTGDVLGAPLFATDILRVPALNHPCVEGEPAYIEQASLTGLKKLYYMPEGADWGADESTLAITTWKFRTDDKFATPRLWGIAPPTGTDWPAYERDRTLYFDVTAEMATPEAVKQAILLVIAKLYDGLEIEAAAGGVRAMLEPYRDVQVGPSSESMMMYQGYY